MFCYVVLLSSFVKAEVVAHGNLYVNKLATFDFKISSPVTVSQ